MVRRTHHGAAASCNVATRIEVFDILQKVGRLPTYDLRSECDLFSANLISQAINEAAPRDYLDRSRRNSADYRHQRDDEEAQPVDGALAIEQRR
ncbi:MAG: hypothetical protein R3E08_11110 [Thiotrichaceae bacterium]